MEIVHIKEVKPEPNPALVKTLETMLSHAKAGNVHTLVVIGNVSGTWLHWSHGINKVQDFLSVSGMLDSAKARILAMIQWKDMKS